MCDSGCGRGGANLPRDVIGCFCRSRSPFACPSFALTVRSLSPSLSRLISSPKSSSLFCPIFVSLSSLGYFSLTLSLSLCRLALEFESLSLFHSLLAFHFKQYFLIFFFSLLLFIIPRPVQLRRRCVEDEARVSGGVKHKYTL